MVQFLFQFFSCWDISCLSLSPHLNIMFCRVLLAVLWVLANASCSWGSHFSAGSRLGSWYIQSLTWELNLLKMIKKANPDMKKHTSRLLCLAHTCIILALVAQYIHISKTNIKFRFRFIVWKMSGTCTLIEHFDCKKYLLWFQLIYDLSKHVDTAVDYITFRKS